MASECSYSESDEDESEVNERNMRRNHDGVFSESDEDNQQICLYGGKNRNHIVDEISTEQFSESDEDDPDNWVKNRGKMLNLLWGRTPTIGDEVTESRQCNPYENSEEKPPFHDVSNSEFLDLSVVDYRDKLLRLLEGDEEDMLEAIANIDLLREYLRQVEESGGFDIDVHPNCGIMGITDMFPQKVCKEQYPDDYMNYLGLAKLAVESYNQNELTQYELEEVQKVNESASNYHKYYITFTARAIKGDEDASQVTFQAKVAVDMVGSKHEKVVSFCRVRPY